MLPVCLLEVTRFESADAKMTLSPPLRGHALSNQAYS